DYLLFLQNVMAHSVLVQLFVVGHFIAVAVWRYATEEREKTRIRHAFQFYLSNEVIEEILRDTKMLKLGGERRVLTVMFSDIRGFTSLSEKLDPAALTELLNEYLTPMTEIVLQQRGTLDKYIGDALMAFFGAPIAFEHHAHAACSSALQMMERLKELNAQWKQRGLPELAIGIGINTGEVSVGNMGSARRFDYTVIGDNVNLASRLEGLNKTYGTSIIISQFTREAIGGHFTCRKLDSVRVKGKMQPVDIYELVRAGPMDEERDGWIVLFERGLELYRNAEFEKALEIFERLEQDAAAGLFAGRCRQLLESPPPQGWDGVFTATTK
ncbi:MAG: adenylate/guanylate cyclase domain-containing protein, partial [Deltaproteobacteria bacterium]